MEYIKLVLGIGLTVTFIWILLKNSKRTSFIHALLRIDTILGVIAGVYLTFTSAYSLLAQ
jgi:hypothetical protein